ncbi:FhaA domain-containing protein [Canibacter zhoujuaniae]|uniref:FhaA domain-containing protein n=1 Tax=Canibacter zhoujuaniae TaxID=2708343 RepID=UPI0014229A0F|nr:DUF3662 and FHA domain-containing protein [Canibacter zhoujuaniae]
MGLLDGIERGLERAVNGAFARTFRASVQPVELAAALKRELDVKAVAVDRDRVLAPNIFTFELATADLAHLEQIGQTLDDELRRVVTNHASEQGYQLIGPAVIELRADEHTPTGTFELKSHKPSNSVSWAATLDLEGQRHPLKLGTTIIGRGSAADIKISDSAASRQHLQIDWDGKRAIARDLGSTNGSKIEGQRFQEVQLHPDSVVYIGQTPLTFRFTPTADPAAGSLKPTPTRSANSSFWEGA